MTKEEMKNKISMALKDPILQQGFEIICKENAELKADNDARKFAMFMSEKVEKQLREENAELKEENAKSNVLFADIIEAFTSCSYNDDFEMAQAGKEIYELFYGGKDPKEVFHNAEVPKSSRQLLVEAKEIIKLLLHALKNEGSEYTFALKNTHPVLEEAEQFLKESE